MLALQASVFWMGALCGVLIFHCAHLTRGCSECRWLHGAHIVMLIGMLIMYASMAFDRGPAPTGLGLAVYVVISAAILVWMAARLLKRDPLERLWILALAQQVAMIYMWAPMRDWVPAVSYGFAFYFALETLGWAMRAARRGARGALALATAGPAPPAKLEGSFLDDACMTVMAASMAYMFVGMQLMMSPSRGGEPPALQEPTVVSHPAPSREGEAERSAAQPAQAAAASPPSRREPERAPLTSSYVIRPGDTLIAIAARLYRDPRLWPHIARVNPGLDPRRLPVGGTIILPEPVPVH